MSHEELIRLTASGFAKVAERLKSDDIRSVAERIAALGEKPSKPPKPSNPTKPSGRVLLDEDWTRGSARGVQLLTNEYAFWNPDDPDAHPDSVWEMDSGSLWIENGTAFDDHDPIDCISPNADSTRGNDNAVFRLVTKNKTYTDYTLEFVAKPRGFVTTARTPAVAWDGIHLFTRYAAENELYYVSIYRRDSTAVIKKKTPGGPSNDGTYHDLSRYVANPAVKDTATYTVTCKTINTKGHVKIALTINGKLIVEAVDDGTYGKPIARGGIGVRADNCAWTSYGLKVTAL